MTYFANIAPRRKPIKETINYTKLYAEQRAKLVDIIEEHVTIGKGLLKLKSGFGDGTFNRRFTDLLELTPHIVYNRKTKIVTDTKAQIDKPLTETEVDKIV